MATSFKSLKERNPGMIFVLSFVVTAIASSLVIYLANMFFPMQVVLGTLTISPLWAVLLVSAKLAIIVTLAWPFLIEWELRSGKELTPFQMLGSYFIINFIAVWVTTRFAEIFGMGVSSWIVIVVLAAVLDIVQGIGMMMLDNMTKVHKK